MTDSGPLPASSGDLIADRRYQLAVDLAARGDLEGAADILAQTVAIAPRFAAAWFALGAIRDRLADKPGAVAAFAQARAADPDDHHGAGLQLARLDGGDDAPAMTEAYVRRLFDQYAGRYDTALIEHLRYRGPAILHDAVAQAMGARGRAFRFATALDLGCGTGLAGVAFRPVVERLMGVDLSPAMIAKAAEKGVYDRTAVAKIEDFVAEASAASERYDLVLAADVFVYLNDIGAIVAGIRKILTPDGILAFTAETHSGDGVTLLPTLRFAYGEANLRSSVVAAGLDLFSLSAATVRSEKGVPVHGLVVVAGSQATGAVRHSP